MQFRKKAIVIEAEQFHAGVYTIDPQSPKHWPRGVYVTAFDPLDPSKGNHTVIDTLGGQVHVSDGDWIITGVKGECYPCKPDIFEATYEPVN